MSIYASCLCSLLGYGRKRPQNWSVRKRRGSNRVYGRLSTTSTLISCDCDLAFVVVDLFVEEFRQSKSSKKSLWFCEFLPIGDPSGLRGGSLLGWNLCGTVGWGAVRGNHMCSVGDLFLAGVSLVRWGFCAVCGDIYESCLTNQWIAHQHQPQQDCRLHQPLF